MSILERPARNRRIYLLLIAIVILTGTSYPKYSDLLPMFINQYAGSTLWALLIFLVTRYLFISTTTFKIALFSVVIIALIESTKFYQAGWFEVVRRSYIGGMIFRHDLVTTDLYAFAGGILLGILLELIVFNIMRH
ncbi:MAG: DUF2809 domain-containing protein [FCB group bacterium]|nr:DUF2809 domain-containing protein [FCB group bacterium]